MEAEGEGLQKDTGRGGWKEIVMVIDRFYFKWLVGLFIFTDNVAFVVIAEFAVGVL